MKMTIKKLKPRNPLVALALTRKAGSHRDRQKFDRQRERAAQQRLEEEMAGPVRHLRALGLL